MLLIFLHYQYSFPQLAFPEKPCQQATFTPHPAKGTPECTEVSNLMLEGMAILGNRASLTLASAALESGSIDMPMDAE